MTCNHIKHIYAWMMGDDFPTWVGMVTTSGGLVKYEPCPETENDESSPDSD